MNSRPNYYNDGESTKAVELIIEPYDQEKFASLEASYEQKQINLFENETLISDLKKELEAAILEKQNISKEINALKFDLNKQYAFRGDKKTV